MPMYEYECPECGYSVTQQRKVANRDVVPLHPHGERDVPMKRCISMSTSFSLKGGGWYSDGYSKNTGTG
jgi:putative FmdB family regulatory protein